METYALLTQKWLDANEKIKWLREIQADLWRGFATELKKQENHEPLFKGLDIDQLRDLKNSVALLIVFYDDAME